jgi:hypothetical protein
VEQAVAEIADLIKRNIAAVVAATPTYFFLTAGRDSRMLLACAKEVAKKLQLVTAEVGDRTAAIDCDTARRIARRHGLNHRVLPHEKARAEDVEDCMFRISYSTSEARGSNVATMLKRLPGAHAILVGSGGELARGYWWRAEDSGATPISPERLIEICDCPLHEEPISRARAWLEGIPSADSLQTLDLFLLEQDMGCWAGVWPYAECDPGFTVFPLCHRRIIERMITLPAAYRRSGDLPGDIVRREWPALLDWPINQPVGTTRLLFGMKRVIGKGLRTLRRPKRNPSSHALP